MSVRGLWLSLVNVLLAILFGFFAYAHAVSFRPSAILIIIKESIAAGFFLIRAQPLYSTRCLYDWLIAIIGTFAPMLFRPINTPDDFLIGSVLQYMGIAIQIISLVSLNRSFGIVPANRGIKTTGLYRFVRHPLYTAYFVGHLGYVINNLSGQNCLVFTATLGLHILRLRTEENFLKNDPLYVTYLNRTRWRLIPFVF